MNRDEMLARIRGRQTPWDVAVIGGGATGLGIAVDAASRGYSVVLLEQHDFGKGTSSRSTKLVHGGVRYLRQGNLSLVRAALEERQRLRRNAPHLVRPLPLLVPAYEWWERPYYGAGLKLYDLLARGSDFGASAVLGRDETSRLLPTLRREGLRGGVRYFDGQFDDARLLLNLASTAAEHGAALVNYAPVEQLRLDGRGAACGLVARDLEADAPLTVDARVIVNATGAFVDQVRRLADDDAAPLVAPSQGTHIVLPRDFLPGDTALMVPRTTDGRVLFAIPWLGHTLVGTTDTAIPDAPLEPVPRHMEIVFLLETAGRYLERAPTAADVLSVFTGVRPLVRGQQGRLTSALSRDHTIHVDGSQLITVTGGKWTTYRLMAEEAVDRAAAVGGLPARPCATETLRIHGYDTEAARHERLAVYGADAPDLLALSCCDASLRQRLHPELALSPDEIVWSVRHEMARTVEDVLARRDRSLFLNARAAVEVAPQVAAIMARELGRDETWQRAQLDGFAATAAAYRVSG